MARERGILLDFYQLLYLSSYYIYENQYKCSVSMTHQPTFIGPRRKCFENIYGLIKDLCVGFRNLRIFWNPLRADEVIFYRQLCGGVRGFYKKKKKKKNKT